MDTEVDAILVAAEELKRPLVTLRQLAFAFTGDSAEDSKLRDEMIGVSDRAIRQINDLTRLRKLDGAMFQMEPVAVRAVCDEVTTELTEMFKHHERHVVVRYGAHLPLVMVNRELLKSVVFNFLTSATFCQDDKINARLTVTQTKNQVRITVRDYGPTLPVDVWREMRQGFMTRPTSIAMRPGSSGLSLFIASKFSKYMNASVGAIRHRDGVSFYVNLPITRQARLFS